MSVTTERVPRLVLLCDHPNCKERINGHAHAVSAAHLLLLVKAARAKDWFYDDDTGKAKCPEHAKLGG